MHQSIGSRRRDNLFNGFGRSVEVKDPSTQRRCQAEERRIHPIVEAVPDLLVVVPNRFRTHPHAHIQLHHAAFLAYTALKRAAEADGIPPHILTIVSGFRSVATQVRLWEVALRRYGSPAAARVFVAPPGSSAHHTGQAIDFYLGIPNDSKNIVRQRTTAVYRWLVCNAGRFGFTPYSAEPWHWEFNPPALNPSLLASGNHALQRPVRAIG